MTDDKFSAFWAAYPHKVGKKAAEKKYWIVRRDTAHETIMHGLALYKETKPSWKAWCNPTTWLNQGRWEDQPADIEKKVEHTDWSVRPKPQYLCPREDDRPKETPEQKARKQLRLDVHEVMRARQLNPLVLRVEDPERYEAEFREIAAMLEARQTGFLKRAKVS